MLLSRAEEIDLIREGIYKEMKTLNKSLEKYNGVILTGDKAKARTEIYKRLVVLENLDKSYQEAKDRLKWDAMLNGVTEKM